MHGTPRGGHTHGQPRRRSGQNPCRRAFGGQGAWGQAGPGDTRWEHPSRRDRIRFTVRSVAQVRLGLRCAVKFCRREKGQATPSRRAHTRHGFLRRVSRLRPDRHTQRKSGQARSPVRARQRACYCASFRDNRRRTTAFCKGTVLPPGIIPERTRARSTRVHRQREFRVMFASRIGGAADPSARRGSF